MGHEPSPLSDIDSDWRMLKNTSFLRGKDLPLLVSFTEGLETTAAWRPQVPGTENAVKMPVLKGNMPSSDFQGSVRLGLESQGQRKN